MPREVRGPAPRGTRGIGAEAARALYGRLRSFLPGLALDIGAGTGLVASQLGGQLVLLDVQDLRGPQAPPAPFVLGSACALPFATGTFTGVHLARVLHHVPDWRLALSEAHRVVAPGGAICVTLGGRMIASELGPLRDAVFEQGQQLGLQGAHHAHGPSGYDDVDAVFGAGEAVEVTEPEWNTPRQVVMDAATHPYAWVAGQDLSPLRDIAARVLAESGLPPDEPVRHDRLVSYRVYRRQG